MTPLVLLRPHTHAGKAHSPGDRLTVSPTTADWLIAQGIAQRDAAAARSPLEKDYEEVGADELRKGFSNPVTVDGFIAECFFKKGRVVGQGTELGFKCRQGHPHFHEVLDRGHPLVFERGCPLIPEKAARRIKPGIDQ